MSNMPIGNEENMAKVRAMMATTEKANEVNMGSKATNVVPIDYVSLEGNTYKGKVEFKRPNVMEIMKMGGRKTQLLKNSGVVDRALADDAVLMMAEAIATLEIVAVRRPEWFIDIATVQETDLIFHVYRKYTEWSYAFRLNGGAEQEGNSEASAGAEDVDAP